MPAELPRDLRRFLTHLDTLRTQLAQVAQRPATGGPESLTGHALYVAGARTPAFMLQGLGRIYGGLELKGLDRETFDRLKTEAKILEDALGQVDFWWSIRREALAYRLPAAVASWAEQRHAEACGRTAAWLEAREWVPHRYLDDGEPFEPRADRLERRLRKMKWVGVRKSSEAFGKFLVTTLGEVDAKLAALDLSDMEHGLHECRRQVRWISVYAFANAGSVVLDQAPKAPRGWARYLTKDVVNNPYNKLPEPSPEDRPLAIPAHLFYALSHLIDRLGQLKDRVQWTETLQAGLDAAAPGGKRPAASYLGDVALHPKDASAQAAALVEQVVRKDRLLERLALAVSACGAPSSPA